MGIRVRQWCLYGVSCWLDVTKVVRHWSPSRWIGSRVREICQSVLGDTWTVAARAGYDLRRRSACVEQMNTEPLILHRGARQKCCGKYQYCGNALLLHLQLTVKSSGLLTALHPRPSRLAGLAVWKGGHFGPDSMCRLIPHQIFQVLPCVTFRKLCV